MRYIASLADMRILLFCSLSPILFGVRVCMFVPKDRLTVLPFVEIEYYGIRSFDAKRNTIIHVHIPKKRLNKTAQPKI